jgi:8-oxo-dGTP pyrophosphatase MutT (NUDIX family)
MDYISYLRSMVGHEKVIMVVAGAFVFDSSQRLLLQLRSDNETWGLPGGFMDLGESVQDTARREVFEETGLRLKKMQLFGVYSGSDKDTTFSNGDKVSMVFILFTCREYEGELLDNNQESLKLQFFHLDSLPKKLFSAHQIFIDDLLSGKETPVIG